MQEEFLDQIKTQLKTGMTEFLAQTDLKEHDLFVLGCSTSEIQGKLSENIQTWISEERSSKL